MLAKKVEKKRGRGRPATGKGTQIVVRVQPAQLADIDNWRTLWPDSPSRAEVIRRLVRGEKPPVAK